MCWTPVIKTRCRIQVYYMNSNSNITIKEIVCIDEYSKLEFSDKEKKTQIANSAHNLELEVWLCYLNTDMLFQWSVLCVYVKLY